MADYQGVMIFAEIADGKLAPISRELLGIGRKLANDLQEELSVLIAGSSVADIAPEPMSFGADKVYIVDDPLLQDYRRHQQAEVGARC